MKIKTVTAVDYLDLVPIFTELEHYYFADNAANREDITHYIRNGLFAEHSGVRVAAAYSSAGQILGFATYTIMYPAPKLSGQLYMKDLFVSAKARGQGVGQHLMRYLAQYALDKGCQRFDWTAESTNPKAGEFYQAIGAAHLIDKEYYRFEGEALRTFAAV